MKVKLKKQKFVTQPRTRLTVATICSILTICVRPHLVRRFHKTST